jgi:hypothetical protein
MNENDILMNEWQNKGVLIFGRFQQGISTIFYHLKGVKLILRLNE